MDTVITVVVVCIMVGMLVLMVNYARFIHRYPGDSEAGPSEKDPVSPKGNARKEDAGNS